MEEWPNHLQPSKLSGGNLVKKALFAVLLIATFATAAMAADAAKSATIAPFISVHGQPGLEPMMSSDWKVPPPAIPFCGTNCLYYAGDFNSASSAANGVCLINNGTNNCETWVGVKPTKNASVQGSTFNVLVFQTTIGTNPTPFNVHTGMSTGKAGKTVCNTKGVATLKSKGPGGFGLPEYSYTIKKLAKACSMTAGKVYYVSMQPTYSSASNWGFLSDVEAPIKNHKGWPTLKDKGFVNYPGGTPPLNYAPLSGSTGGCGGIGCDAMSIALTGK
jgi:hypothetical protein